MNKHLLLLVTFITVPFKSFSEIDNPQKTGALEEIISINNKETGFEVFESLKEIDPFNYKKIINEKNENKRKHLFSTEEFFLEKGTKILLNGKVMKLPRSVRVKVLYNPTLKLNDVVDRNGLIVFKVETKNLISTSNSEGIERGTVDLVEKKIEIIDDQKNSKLFFRFGYGGSLFEDSFNGQFLTGVNDKIYAGCLELQLEGLYQSSENFHFGGGTYLTTGQYVSLDGGPVFQNLSLGPIAKYALGDYFFIGAGINYTLAHDINVNSAINIQNVFFERFINIEILDKKNISFWAFGLKLKFIDHKVKFQDQTNTFNQNQTSVSLGAYVSKGFNTFSF